MEGQLPQDTSNRGTIIFVLGLLGFFTGCLGWILAPIAFFMGQNYKRDCLAEGMRPSGLGEAGRIMGLIGMIFAAIGILFVGFYIICLGGVIIADM